MEAAPAEASATRRFSLVAAPAWTWLAGLVAASAVFRFAVALGAPVPWVFPDEWVYAELAHSLSASGGFSVWGLDWPVQGSGPLYPVLVSPLFALADSVEHALVLVKALNAILMSLAALPAYALARRVARKELAFFAAVLAVLVPSMVYTSMVMSESLAYPLFLATALAFVRTLERPTRARETLALALIVVCFFARAELIVLLPLYLAAVLAMTVREAGGRGRELLHALAAYRITALVGAAACLALLVLLLVDAGTVLGIYDNVPAKLRPLALPRWLAYQLAELDLAVGVIPFAASIVAFVVARRQTHLSRSVHAVAAVGAAAFGAFMLLGAIYGTQERASPHVFERYVVYVMPFLFAGFAFWLERGLPRPRGWTLAATALAALLPAALPYSTLLNGAEWGVSTSTPGLVFWATFANALGTHAALVVAVLVVSGGLSLVFLRVGPKRASLPGFLTFLLLWSLTMACGWMNHSLSAQAAGKGPSVLTWVDDEVGTDARVGAVWVGSRARGPNAAEAVLQTQFFNRSVGAVYDLREPIKPQVPSTAVSLRNGVLVIRKTETPPPIDYVVADATLRLQGTIVARERQGHLVLYRLTPAS